MSGIPTPAQRWWPGSGVSGLLGEAAHARSDATYLEDHRGTKLSFAETEDAARRLAGFLRARGVGRGDRVVIHLQNRAEVAVALYAASLVGAVYVVLNAKLKPRGVSKILEQAEPVAVVVDGSTRENLEDECAVATRIFVEDAEDAEVPGSWTAWSEALANPPFEGEWSGCDVDPACLVFTSGSTGAPRGVTLSHDNIRYVVGAIQQRLGYRPEDTVGCFLPLAFDYGLYQIFLAAQAGAKLYLGDPGQVGPRLPQVMNAAGVSVLPGVPSIYAALIALARRRPFELPALRAITNTGERLPSSHIEEMRRLCPDLDVYVMYGLTECKRVSIMTPGELETHPDSVGRALAGTEVYAVDDEGARLPPGEVGELVVRGRHVAHGYWRAPEETAKRFRKRAPESAVELFTGDAGSVDADGFIHFSGRTDDLIKHRGNRISPVEIEKEACTVPGVVEAGVLKRDADDTLHLFVTTSEALEEDAVLRALGETLEPAKVPDCVVEVESMPKSMNGKIDRRALAEHLAES